MTSFALEIMYPWEGQEYEAKIYKSNLGLANNYMLKGQLAI